MDSARHCFARHSETLEWHEVFENGGRFRIVPCEEPESSYDLSVSPQWQAAFEATHMHYKGGLYRVEGIGRIVADAEEYVVYCDGVGNYWVRPRAMFEGTMPNGRLRFTPFSLPTCR